MYDLRSFIDTVTQERPRDIVHIWRTVDPRFETAAIITKLERALRFPIVFFHNIAGSPFPLVSNVCASKARLALALDCSPHELPQRYSNACSHPLKPHLQENGAVQERVWTGDDVNLGILPQLVYHLDDAPRPYITAAIVVARDPETRRCNLSFHRLMVLNRTNTTLFMERGKHLDRIFRKFEMAGQPMPIAAFIGVSPACCLGALYTGSGDTEEYDIIGGLQECPLALVKCLTNDLQVPASAEFVFEGIVSTDSQAREGPFGEFTGYSTGSTLAPVFCVQAISSRGNPIFQDIVSGQSEHLLLPILGMEHYLLEIARAVVPSTTHVRLSLPLTAFVSLNKLDDSQPRLIIQALLRSNIYIKQVVVVDVDVDTSDLRQVNTAIALQVKPDRDVFICHGKPATELDPSAEPGHGKSAKIGFDATVPLKGRRPLAKNRLPQELLDSIDLSEILGSVDVSAGS